MGQTTTEPRPISSDGGNDQISLHCLESASSGEKSERPTLLRHVLPSRKSYILSHPFKTLFYIVACFTTATSIYQFKRIQKLENGMRRVPNDPYDNTFWRVGRTSPAVWDIRQQSFIHDAVPVKVHSHNDEWRSIPLFEALASGCISVEADVHLRGTDLLVGHSASSLRSNETLRSLYLDPLQRMLEEQNVDSANDTLQGIFNRAPKQTVVLLVDHKTDGVETFAELYRQLRPLRDLDYLTYWNGTDRVSRPLTVVATGNASFASVVAVNETHRDIFFDAPLDNLHSALDDFQADHPISFYNTSNSYYASTKWTRAKFDSHAAKDSTPLLKDTKGSQIQWAQARGLIARYWDAPSSPPNVQDIVLRVLIDWDVGVLNMDDMGLVRARARGLGELGS